MRTADRMDRTARPVARAVAAAAAVAALAMALLLVGAPPADGARGAPGGAAAVADEPWLWPATPPRIVNGYAAPSHDYGPGHRGIDIAASDRLRAPAGGTVAFVGVVVDRPLITIDHGGGLVSTLEPVTTQLSVGDEVAAGDDVGAVASGGHAPPGSVHFGVRLDGEYIDPLLLLGGMPRAILLPCC